MGPALTGEPPPGGVTLMANAAGPRLTNTTATAKKLDTDKTIRRISFVLSLSGSGLRSGVTIRSRLGVCRHRQRLPISEVSSAYLG
jgi:hypothetical protein